VPAIALARARIVWIGLEPDWSNCRNWFVDGAGGDAGLVGLAPDAGLEVVERPRAVEVDHRLRRAGTPLAGAVRVERLVGVRAHTVVDRVGERVLLARYVPEPVL
jgi:hypothetical protein